MPWEKSYDETDVLEAAMRAFWAHGFKATSIADLVAGTGLNRGSLYAGFGNKRDIFLLALQHYDRRYRMEVFEDLRRGKDPKEAIFAAFDLADQGKSDTATRLSYGEFCNGVGTTRPRDCNHDQRQHAAGRGLICRLPACGKGQRRSSRMQGHQRHREIASGAYGRAFRIASCQDEQRGFRRGSRRIAQYA